MKIKNTDFSETNAYYNTLANDNLNINRIRIEWTPKNRQNEFFKIFKKNLFLIEWNLQTVSKKCFSAIFKKPIEYTRFAKTLFSHVKNATKLKGENLFLCGVFDEKRDALKNFKTKRRDPNKDSR